MKVLLEATDRIVCQYNGTAEQPRDIVIAYDASTEAYLVLSRSPRKNYAEAEWDCNWRGDWRSTSNWWFEMISDMQSDNTL